MGKKIGRKKATEEEERSICLMIEVKSTGGQVRALLKVRHHEGSRQLNPAGQLQAAQKPEGAQASTQQYMGLTGAVPQCQ